MCSFSVCPDELLLIVSFFCVSLGPWCSLLRLATSHPSQLARVRIFLQSAWFERLTEVAVHVSSTMAGLMLSRHHSLILESLPAGCTRGYASCVHREFSVFSSTRTSTCCGSPQHPFRALRAHKALSPELDCSGRCLAKRLHEPCFHEHCTNSSPVKLLITRSIKLNNVRSLSDLTNSLECYIAESCFSVCGFLSSSSAKFVVVYHSADFLWHLPHHYVALRYCVIVGSR